MQPELLFTATTVAAPHLLQLVGALFPVDVLFEWIEIEQGEHFAARVVGPERCDDLLFDGTGIAVERDNCIGLDVLFISSSFRYSLLTLRVHSAASP